MLSVSTPTPTPSIPSPVHPGVYTPRERFIRLPEVLYTTGLSRSTVYEMMSPAPTTPTRSSPAR